MTTIDASPLPRPTMSAPARVVRLFGILLYAAGLIVLVTGFAPLGISSNSLAFLAWMIFAPLVMQGLARSAVRVVAPLTRR